MLSRVSAMIEDHIIEHFNVTVITAMSNVREHLPLIEWCSEGIWQSKDDNIIDG